MTIDELKRALVEVKKICVKNGFICGGCPFDKGFCSINNLPQDWDIDDWKEDSK